MPLDNARKFHSKITVAVPAGFSDGTTATSEGVYRFALAGVPVVAGPGKTCGRIDDGDLKFSLEAASSASVMDLRRRLDERAGGKTPVVVESPSVGLVLPRVTPDGTIRSVVFVNARIDSQKGIRMHIRGVAPGVDKAVWWAFHERPVELKLERNGDDAFVVIPSISAWNCGWLAFAR